MTSVFSWENFISLFSALFCIPRSNLLVTPGIPQLPTFAFQSPIMKRTSLFFFGSFRYNQLTRDIFVAFYIVHAG